jgi:transcriptional regulator with XRE-family HTH domain
MTVVQLATAIGISESALRRIENGTSRNTRGETLLLILAWAFSRGIRSFAGFRIEPRPAGGFSIGAEPVQ